MELSSWMVFLMVSLATTFSPGPGVLFAVSNSVSLGPRKACSSSMGNVVGVFIVAGTTNAGLGLLLQSSANAFLFLKIAGASYLIYLGIRQWISKTNVFEQKTVSTSKHQGKTVQDSRLFLQGMLVATTNPKGILFFTALFPQFLNQKNFSISRFFMLTFTFCLCVVLSHISYIVLAGKAKVFFSDQKRAKVFNKVTGLIFVLMGVSLLGLSAGG